MPAQTASELAKRRNLRARAVIVAMVIAIALGGWWLYVYMQQVHAVRAAEHKHTFDEYVVTHHLGTLELIDSGTGLDAMSYVLTVNRPVPDAQRAAWAENLMRLYVQYDHGSLLTIQSINPTTHKPNPIAQCHYDDDTRQFQMTVDLSNGQTRVINQVVNWLPSSGQGS
ncbi:MAG: hypothetical protein K6T78_01860 [Alicyclobacillus sp.]|nr:hypothetical protein [Alicyclobacillus sp.]